MYHRFVERDDGKDGAIRRSLAATPTRAAPATRRLQLAQARNAVTSPAHRAQFEADPVAFVQRFGLGHFARGGDEARALVGLDARSADPSGESAAHSALVLSPSPIHGDGVFAGAPISAGTVVSRLVVGEDVSYTASKVNQSENVNVAPTGPATSQVLTATQDLGPGEEVLADYPYPGKA